MGHSPGCATYIHTHRMPICTLLYKLELLPFDTAKTPCPLPSGRFSWHHIRYAHVHDTAHRQVCWLVTCGTSLEPASFCRKWIHYTVLSAKFRHIPTISLWPCPWDGSWVMCRLHCLIGEPGDLRLVPFPSYLAAQAFAALLLLFLFPSLKRFCILLSWFIYFWLLGLIE